jgi:hypothetical protein
VEVLPSYSGLNIEVSGYSKVLLLSTRIDGVTEMSTVEVTLYACIQEMLGSNLGRSTCYPEVFRSFPQPFQANLEAVFQIRP